MTLNARLLKLLTDTAERAQNTSDALFYNVSKGRVSHTLTSLRNVIREIATLRKHTETDASFVKALEFALFQSQKGPTEIRYEKPSTVFIQGSFDITALREFFIVNEPKGMITISIKGPKK